MKALLVLSFLCISATSFGQAVFAKVKQTGYVVRIYKDTAELDPGIHFIKVDGKIFEIKRATSIQEAPPDYRSIFGPGLKIDTSLIGKPGVIPFGTVRQYTLVHD